MDAIKTVPEQGADNLKEGRCPDHGIRMTQVARQYLESKDRVHTIFVCPRKNCGVRARAQTFHGPWTLITD